MKKKSNFRRDIQSRHEIDSKRPQIIRTVPIEEIVYAESKENTELTTDESPADTEKKTKRGRTAKGDTETV